MDFRQMAEVADWKYQITAFKELLELESTLASERGLL
jgi:hypothetical protein